jgi:TruD family tRNA pseudouridine synthase
MKWEEQKKQEAKYLKEIRTSHPELFKKINWIEDAEFLRTFGIYIPDKEGFIPAHIKLFPQDFIVEEIDINNKQHTVEVKKVLDETTTTDPAAQTIYATLVKCGFSTLEAIDEICRQLNCRKEQVQYSGIKDKRAITAQKISFRNIPLDQIKKLSSPFFFLKDIEGGKGAVEKGRLIGNRFTLYIRTQPGALTPEVRKTLAEKIQKIANEGFYNFFYLQRFASPRLINAQWGLSILRGDYKAAIKEFLTDRTERETPFFGNIRGEIKKNLGDWDAVSKILEPLPSFRCERIIVEHLKKNPEDLVGALNSISDQTSFWVQGLSSLIFNEKLSSFIQNNQKPPEQLPTMLSGNIKEVQIYADLLKELGIYPLPLNNLRPFPTIQIKQQMIPTMGRVDFHDVEILDSGIILSFSLDKGEYATTFLSHLFNLVSGPATENVNTEILDIQKRLGKETGSHEKFKDALSLMLGEDEE